MRILLTKVKEGVYHIPDHVSPGPRDLLTKMLVIDPKLRPSLREVMAHPWFTSQEPKKTFDLASPFEANTIDEGYPESYQFETDLLEALNLLGWNDNEQLISNLIAKE